MGIVNKISDFFKGVFGELKKVNWPTRKEAIKLTWVVIVSVLVAMAIVAVIDYGLSNILELIIAS